MTCTCRFQGTADLEPLIIHIGLFKDRTPSTGRFPACVHSYIRTHVYMFQMLPQFSPDLEHAIICALDFIEIVYIHVHVDL